MHLSREAFTHNKKHLAIIGTGMDTNIQNKEYIQPNVTKSGAGETKCSKTEERTAVPNRVSPCVRPSSSCSFLETSVRVRPEPAVQQLATAVGFLSTSTTALRKGSAGAMHQAVFRLG